MFLFLSVIFLNHIYRFLKYFYENPLLTNTYGEFIPSKKIIDEYIIENKDGSFSAVICLEGYSYFKAENLDQSELENLQIRERALNFKDLKENIHIKFLFKRFKNENGYSNRNYIEINCVNKIELIDVSNKILSQFHDFKSNLLQGDALLNFIFFNCNLVEKHIVNKELNIYDIASYSSIDFFNNYGELNNANIKKYFKCYSFNFGSLIDNKYFAKMLSANLEFDFIINTKFFEKLNAKNLVFLDKKNINSSKSVKENGLLAKHLTTSNKKISELDEVSEILNNETANLALYDVFILLYDNTLEGLLKSELGLKELINKYEIFLIEETRLLNFFFLQKLIGFKLHHTFKFLAEETDMFLYAKKVLSSTIAGLFDFINMPSGLSSCDWGDKPICNFSTNYNNLYNFYLHVKEEKTAIGHGVIIAPSGGGKTTFMQYVMKGILDNYLDVDIYSFDRLNGISIFSNWVNGEDVNFLELSINPLQIDLESEENREFLYNFLSMIAKPENTEDKDVLNSFVLEIALLPKELRILTLLLENDTLPPSKVKDNLEIWANGNYAKYINASADKFSLDGRMLNFQMDKILDDEELSAPIIYYIMFKIRQKAKETSRGHFIFIDESAKMVKNPFFQAQLEILLQEHRKLRGCIWVAFQNPNAFLGDKKLKELILNQCQNQLLFSSIGIKDDVLENLNINKSIYNELIETQNNTQNPYFVLLKRPQENVILNVNLKEKLGSNLKFLSSSVADVNKMKELKQEYGDKWVEYF
jgi:type IV secretory pathway VirB4 component